MNDWTGKSAADLGRGIASGEIDPVELCEQTLDAATRHPVFARIYARLTPERALSEAKAARNRALEGKRRSILDGVPISWKDLFDTAGVATEAGSALLAGRVPERDAEVLRVATEMGLVCLGKTHMSELAFSGLGLNPVTETSPCINDPEAVSGGSSSGAAASVAHGIAPAAIGSDTGGSVRIPAAWNDLVGLKTTSGQLSLEGTVPLAPRFDTVGPLTRTVEDAALLLAALEGRNAPAPQAAPLRGRRFALLETVALDDLRDTPAAGYDRALEALKSAGAELVPLKVPFLEDAMALSAVLYSSEAYGIWRDTIEAAPEKMFDQILERFRGGKDFSAPDYVAAWVELDRHRKRWLDETAEFDAVLCPTCPILPPTTARLLSDHAYYVRENLLTLRNTRIGNLMGLSALTLPTGIPSTGISLMCAPMQEETLLGLGRAAEATIGMVPAG
ncbi:aspartyl-tRNA(Asn)/glutamyl-tRNA(Gln) amidotransferase subunit A [Poseidonocella pacifica]|uniref:Aspartyl-tRNA(Asn)/glutamyl-tRNA(Gln) amidotransferase subunit A n=1 Tax=Poseidonocella pacifica TaxID=871651 RepID=A0A1I0XIN0_9RHOB|nr:amidase family protein [Poseidonocella pacifica]SFB00276.1 aspartyl-tRNA(Asn)/glutamyl-tRNA(Gln) amidotransferase subunit A [Poseidonocella pacifica]